MEVDVLKRVPVREQEPKVRATNFERSSAWVIIKKKQLQKHPAVYSVKIHNV